MIDVDDATRGHHDVSALQRLAGFLLGELRMHPDSELSVRLVDEGEMAALNAKFMDAPGPTDVLAFPMDELRIPLDGAEPTMGVLGDVVLCPSYAADQANEIGHDIDDELALLLTHGVLHLLGHDHAEADDHHRMFTLQGELLEKWRASRELNGVLPS